MKQQFLNALEPSQVPSFWGGKPEMRQYFLNALEPAPVGFFEKGPGRMRDPFEVFDAILISYHYWDRWPRIPTDSLIVGDSGGFSVATLGAKIDPVSVIRWQQKCADIGYILDIPPYRGSATSARAGGRAADYWDDSLRRTLSNVERAFKHYDPDDPTFQWWGVIQGEIREQQDEWFGRVSEIYPFEGAEEGWAMRPHPNNDYQSIARCVRFAADNEIPNLHLLQTTGPSAVSILLALGEENGLRFATYDSETAARLSVTRGCTVRPESFPAFSLKNISEVSRAGETTVRDYMLSGDCGCISCQWFAEDELDQDEEYSHYIMLHNYCVMRDNFAAIHEAALSDPDQLLREALGKEYGATRRAFAYPYRSGITGHQTRSLFDL